MLNCNSCLGFIARVNFTPLKNWLFLVSKSEKKTRLKIKCSVSYWDESAAVYLMTLGSYKTSRQHSSGQIKKYNCNFKKKQKKTAIINCLNLSLIKNQYIYLKDLDRNLCLLCIQMWVTISAWHWSMLTKRGGAVNIESW